MAYTKENPGTGARHTGKAKQAMLEEIYGDEATIELDQVTGKAKINGELCYITAPTRRLSVRHQLIADLAGAGLKGTDIGRALGAKSPQSANHYNQLLRDPRIRARANAKTADVTAEATSILKEATTQAARNIHTAVMGGDVGVSKYVLATQGITEKKDHAPSGPSVNMDFGSWLSSVSNTKDKYEIEEQKPKEIDITHDVTEIPQATDGERL